MRRPYYEEIGLEPSYTDEHLFDQLDNSDLNTKEDKWLNQLLDALSRGGVK